jgi:PAS domain S-box-containing protein
VTNLRGHQGELLENDINSAFSTAFGAAGSSLAQLAAAFLGDLSSQRKSLLDSSQSTDAPRVSEELVPSIEARYKVLVEQIPAVVFMAYLDGGLSEAYVSPHIEHTLGFSQEEWLDDPLRWYYQIHPDDRARWSVEAAETFLTGNPLKSIYRVLAADGRVVWFRCEAKLVRRKNGQPWFIHGVGFDITDLKATELALERETAERERLQKLELQRQIAKTEQSEAQLAAIVESSEDAIIGKTLDGTITNWNAAATRLFGYEAAEIVGKSVWMLFPPELHGEEARTLQIVSEGKAIAHQQTQNITKSGTRIDVSRTISPIKSPSGQVIGVSTIARDITQQKQMEEKLRMTEKLAATGRLAATIAHEINNPLESVTNLLYLAQRDQSASPKLRQYLKVADEELDRVAHLAKQTLGFYRDSASPRAFNVTSTINDVVMMYSRRAMARNVDVETELDPDIEAFGFAGEFRQVLSNLIGNSLDAMSEHGGRLIVRARKSRDWNTGIDRLGVSIADTGIGIPADKGRKIFDAFFTTKTHFGTGLGLWLSRSIIQKHGGSIRFRSRVTVGRSGTVISFSWPLTAQSSGLENAA